MKNGTYVAPGQAPIIVVDGGELENGMRGPWVRWRFPWDPEDKLTDTLWNVFEAMVKDAGYVLEETPAGA